MIEALKMIEKSLGDLGRLSGEFEKDKKKLPKKYVNTINQINKEISEQVKNNDILGASESMNQLKKLIERLANDNNAGDK
jgi:transcriptional regulator with GAF, ATPase, and Fis domain